MTPEKKVKAKIKKVLDKIGSYYFMPATGGYGASGVPDFIICYRGGFIGVEAKANGGKPTALQRKHLLDITTNRGRSFIIDENNVDMLELLIVGKQTFNKEEKE